MIGLLITVIQSISLALILIVVIDVILSYIVQPYQPWKNYLDRFVNIFLNPIRKFLPGTFQIDISPLVFILLVRVVETILLGIILSLRA